MMDMTILMKRGITKIMSNNIYKTLNDKMIDYNMYKLVIEKKLGFTILRDMSETIWKGNGKGINLDDTSIRLLCTTADEDMPDTVYYYFYDIFTGAALSLQGFKTTVIEEGNYEDFKEGIINRMTGSRVTKEEVIAKLIMNNDYLIDSIYKDKKLTIPDRALPDLFHWVNLLGGFNPKLSHRKTSAPPTR